MIVRILVMAIVVIFDSSIATDEDNENITKKAEAIIKFMDTMGYEFKRKRK